MKAPVLFLAGVVAAMSLPQAALGQDSDLPLSIGDSVKVTIWEDDWSGAWTGSVYEVKNQRNCFFVVYSHLLDGDMSSFGLDLPDYLTVTRYLADGSTEKITTPDLRQHGIECVEVNPTPERPYLLPESQAEGA